MKGGDLFTHEIYFKFQKKIVLTFSILGAITFISFGLLHLYDANFFIGVSELIIATSLLINLGFFVYFKKEEPYTTLIMLIILSAYGLLIMTGGFGGTGVVWIHSFPVITYALMRLRKGTFWVISFFIAFISLIIFQRIGIIQTAFSSLELQQNLISTLVLSILVYLFIRYLEQREEVFVVQDKQMIDLNKKLEKSILKVIEQKAQNQAFLKSIGDGLIATDSLGRVVLVNPSAMKMLELNKKQMIHKDVKKILLLRDRNSKLIVKKNNPIDYVLGSDTSDKSTLLLKDPYYYKKVKGDLLPIDITIAPILIEKKAVGAIITFRDISEEVRISEEKTEFISIASHQLRSPLTSLRWNFEMLQDYKLNSEVRGIVEGAVESVNFMVRLVNDLLDVSRIEIGSIKFDPKKINIQHMIESVVTEIKPAAQKNGVKVSVKEYQRHFEKIIIDEKLLRQVIASLLANAIRYSKLKKGEIEMQYLIRDSDLLISVKDNGIGIEKSVQGKIFTKFFRTPRAKKNNNQGTGLGLYFSKMAVEAMHGKIWFKSEKNKGSEFFVQVPIDFKE